MPIVDLIAGAVIVGAAAWGFTRGAERMLPFAGFAAGAVLGTRMPLIAGGELDSSFSLLVALPAALIIGATLAAVVERFGTRLAAPLARRRGIDAVAGVLLGTLTAAVGLWILGPVATQLRSLREPVRDSALLARLDGVLTPAGPQLSDTVSAPSDELPVIAGPAPQVAAADPRASADPDVRAAVRSIVKVIAPGCRRVRQGSGWIAADGTVVTNAHVVAGASNISVRVAGTGPPRVATAIWFEPRNDLAVLRVPALAGIRALTMVERPRIGTSGASVGFPRNRRAIRSARLGTTTRDQAGGIRNAPRGFRRNVRGRLVTLFRGRVQGGSSGSAVVDTHGRVLTTVFAALAPGSSGVGIPNRFVRAALGKAGPRVTTGRC